MFNNSNSLQLIYVQTLADVLAKAVIDPGTKTPKDKAIEVGNLTVLLYTNFVNFLRWSIGFYIMKSGQKKVDNYLQTAVDEPPRKDSSMIKEDVTGRMLDISSVDGRQTALAMNNENKPAENSSDWKRILKESINMPFISGAFAIILSSIPYVSVYFRDENKIGYKFLTGNH
jgi:predicted permease